MSHLPAGDRGSDERAATESAGTGAGQAVTEPAAAPPLKSWEEMREWAARLLRSRTGQDVAAWNRRVAEAGLPDEQALRAWLDGQGVTGYAQALLVWERFGYPDFLTAEAGELIAGQYSDRPQLRPVLDAVLAALPELGALTVQARKTLISLVTPRRTFAVVQPTTKSRMDLGLRLEHERPGGRLLAARDLGAATVRIPLTRPEDVDAEVLGLLRRAYQENTAPPPAQRTALCTRARDRSGLVVPGKPWLVTEPVPGDAPSARWEVPVTVRREAGGLDFSGPHVRGDRADRHLFLAWGEVHDDGTLRLIRGSKLKLADADPRLVEEAMRPGRWLVARIRLTGAQGERALTWSAEPAPAEAG